MLNQMRSGASSIFAKLLLILLILSFSIWGVGDMLRLGGAGGPVATVGGQEISRASFEHSLHNAREGLRQQMGKNYSPEIARAVHVERKVLEEMITAEMLQQEVRALGIIPPDEAVADLFKNDAGAFDKALFQNALHHSGMGEKAFVDDVRRQLAVRLLVESVSAAAPGNSAMQRVLYGAENEDRTADIAELSPALVKDIPSPTEDDIKTYYDAHKNEFFTKEYRMVHTLSISKEDLLKAENMSADHVEEAMVAFSNKLEDMLASGDSLQEAATQLKVQYLNTGPFDREGKGPNGEKLSLPDGFASNAFAREEDQETHLKPSKDGVHYIMQRVDVTQPEAPQPLNKVHDKVEDAWHRQESIKRLSALAESIGKEARESKTPLAVLATHGIRVSSTVALKRNSKSPLPPALLRDVFLTPVGGATGIYPTQTGFAIAVVKSRKPGVNITPKALEKDIQFALFTLDVDKAMRNELLDNYLRYLRNKYRVKVNNEALAAYADIQE